MSLNIISISVICSGFKVKKLNTGKRENLNISLMKNGEVKCVSGNEKTLGL